MAKIRYTGPSDAVTISVDGAERECVRNHQVDVPDDVAGHAPDPRVAVALEGLAAAIAAGDHGLTDALTKEIDGLDRGSGLLAQDIWAAVEAKKIEKKEDDK